MRTDVSSSDLKRYQEDGYLVIESFLEPAELREWQAVLGGAMDDASRRPGDIGVNRYARDLQDWNDDCRRLLRDPQPGSVVGALEGLTAVRHLNSTGAWRPPHYRGNEWHVNMHEYLPFDSYHGVAMYLYLVDATRALGNGVLWCLPGLHREGEAELTAYPKPPGVGGLFVRYPEWEHMDAVPIEGAAGTAVFYNLLVPHATTSNMTPRPLPIVINMYCGDGELYNGRNNGRPYASRLKAGDVLADDDIPVVWTAKD